MDLNPRYSFDPFRRVSKLAEILKEPENVLRRLGSHSEEYYRRVPIVTKGKLRETWDAKPPLKAVQARIRSKLLKQVEYPPYLLGGLPRRDYVSNARLHSGKRTVIVADIQGFFPSTPVTAIKNIWGGLFHFPESITDILTGLTTLGGVLPQGAKTSSYLANLVFWDREPKLVAELQEDSIVYSRYIDDITISSQNDIDDQMISHVTKRIVEMLSRWGMCLKRAKTRVARSGSQMMATGLIVNRGVGLPHQKRSQVRAHVRELERMHELGEATYSCAYYALEWQRANGRAHNLALFHATQGTALLHRLAKIRPT